LKGNKFLEYICQNFDNIKLKLERSCTSLIAPCISLENIVVSKENYDLFVTRIEDMFKGFSLVDFEWILEEIEDEYKFIFFEEYGYVSDDERILNEVVGSIINLIIASKSQVFPKWGKKYLNKINDEGLLKKAITLVQWC
jgi:hypothetical protein